MELDQVLRDLSKELDSLEENIVRARAACRSADRRGDKWGLKFQSPARSPGVARVLGTLSAAKTPSQLAVKLRGSVAMLSGEIRQKQAVLGRLERQCLLADLKKLGGMRVSPFRKKPL